MSRDFPRRNPRAASSPEFQRSSQRSSKPMADGSRTEASLPPDPEAASSSRRESNDEALRSSNGEQSDLSKRIPTWILFESATARSTLLETFRDGKLRPKSDSEWLTYVFRSVLADQVRKPDEPKFNLGFRAVVSPEKSVSYAVELNQVMDSLRQVFTELKVSREQARASDRSSSDPLHGVESEDLRQMLKSTLDAIDSGRQSIEATSREIRAVERSLQERQMPLSLWKVCLRTCIPLTEAYGVPFEFTTEPHKNISSRFDEAPAKVRVELVDAVIAWDYPQTGARDRRLLYKEIMSEAVVRTSRWKDDGEHFSISDYEIVKRPTVISSRPLIETKAHIRQSMHGYIPSFLSVATDLLEGRMDSQSWRDRWLVAGFWYAHLDGEAFLGDRDTAESSDARQPLDPFGPETSETGGFVSAAVSHIRRRILGSFDEP